MTENRNVSLSWWESNIGPCHQRQTHMGEVQGLTLNPLHVPSSRHSSVGGPEHRPRPHRTRGQVCPPWASPWYSCCLHWAQGGGWAVRLLLTLLLRPGLRGLDRPGSHHYGESAAESPSRLCPREGWHQRVEVRLREPQSISSPVSHGSKTRLV